MLGQQKQKISMDVVKQIENNISNKEPLDVETFEEKKKKRHAWRKSQRITPSSETCSLADLQKLLKEKISKKSQEKKAETEAQRNIFAMFLRNLKFTCISEMRIENRSMIKRNMQSLKKAIIPVKRIDPVRQSLLLQSQSRLFLIIVHHSNKS